MSTEFLTKYETLLIICLFFSFDEFMSASDDSPDNLVTPRRNEEFHVMSAKIKRAHARPTSDHDYFCEVLSQMCDQPEKAQIEFNFNETWKSIVIDLESERDDVPNEEQTDRNEEHLNEEQIRERMKEIELSYSDNLQVQQEGKDNNEEEPHKEFSDEENKDSNKEVNHLSQDIDICDTMKEESSFDLSNISGENTIQYEIPDDFDEEYAAFIQEMEATFPDSPQKEEKYDDIKEIDAAFPDSPQKDQTHSVDNTWLNCSPLRSANEFDAFFPASPQQDNVSDIFKELFNRSDKTDQTPSVDNAFLNCSPQLKVNVFEEEHSDIKQEIDALFPTSPQQDTLSDIIKESSNRSGKTLGIKHNVRCQEPISVNPGPSLPSINSSPVHLPAQSQFRELLNVPSTRYIPSFSTSRVHPFKMRQRSAFARKPVRMRHMEKMIETFRNEREDISRTAANSKSTIRWNEDQKTIGSTIGPKDKNVLFGNITFEHPPLFPVLDKSTVPQDPPFWLKQGASTSSSDIFKDDGFKLFGDKLESNESSTLFGNITFEHQPLFPVIDKSTVPQDPQFWLNQRASTSASDIFKDGWDGTSTPNLFGL